MSDLDLKAMRRRALALTNGVGEVPRVVYRYEDDDNPGQLFESRAELAPLPDGPYRHPAGCVVYVADDQTLCEVPPYDGEQMTEVAEAIANAGPDIFALIAEVERLRAIIGPASAAAMSATPDKFHSFDGEAHETHATPEEARAACQDALECFRDQAYEGWPEEVRRIAWGPIAERVVEVLRVEHLAGCVKASGRYECADGCEVGGDWDSRTDYSLVEVTR